MKGRGWHVAVMVATLGMGLARHASAQTPAAAPAAPPKHEGSAEFAFVGTGGNTSTRTVGLSGDLTLRPSAWSYRFKSSYVQNQSKGVVSARTFTVSARAERQFKSKTSVFGQVAYLRDIFSGISDRSVVEGGVAHTWEKGRQSLVVDASAGYANEQRLVPPNLSTGLVGGGGHYKLKFGTGSDFTDDLRYTKSIQTGAGYRADHVAAVTAKINTALSLKLSNTIRYVSAPVAGFKRTDTITSMALVVKF